MNIGAAALTVAIGKIGEREHGGKNQGPIVTWSVERFTRHKPEEPYDGKTGWAAWCAGFVGRCLIEAGALIPWWSLLCTTLWQRLEARPKDGGAGDYQVVMAPWEPGAELPEPGDLVFFGPSADKLRHVGLVERVEGLTLHTVEGNTQEVPGGPSVAVARRTHDLVTADVFGFARLL
jgi:hypothetical protein